MANYLIESSSNNPWYNLAVEYYLMSRVNEGDLILYLWQNENTVVIGKNQNALKECRAYLLEEENGFLARRTTGGGTVYHDLGNLCFTFLASPERYDLKKQSAIIIDACSEFGIKTCFSGRNDILTEDGFKFSGNAFSSTPTCNIQHGTLMINVNKERLARYLTPSQEKIRAKGIASVKSRVCNLKELNDKITTNNMKDQLIKSFIKEYGEVQILSEEILNSDLIVERFNLYSSWEWIYGESPKCDIDYHKRFEWGELEVQMHLEGLRIKDVKVYSDALDVELPFEIEKLLKGRKYDLTDIGSEEIAGDTIRKQQLMDIVKWIKEMIQ